MESGIRFIDATEADGHGLHPNEFYVKMFIINHEQNKATDPVPFKIAPEVLQKFAETVVGRPWIAFPPDNTKHVRGADTIQGILDYQKQFATGEFVKVIAGASGNIYGFAKIFPEYIPLLKKAREEGKLLPFTSPLVRMAKFNDKGEVIEGEIIHVQNVGTPGYGEVAKVAGMCEGMLNKCMQELRIAGASGQLLDYQKKLGGHSASNPNYLQTGHFDHRMSGKTLPQELITEIAGASGKEASVAVTEFAKTYPSVFEKLAKGSEVSNEENKNKPAKAPAAAEEPQGKGDDKTPKQLELPEEVKQKLAEHDELVKKWQERDAEEAKEKRLGYARIIAKAEVLRKELPADKLDARVQELFELKDGESPVDLSFTAKREEKAIEKIAGASGNPYGLPRHTMAGASGAGDKSAADVLGFMKEVGY